MLDLTKVNRYYQIKWFDGQELNLKRPSQELFEKIFKLQNAEPEQQVSALFALIHEILNNNVEQRVFTKDELDRELDFQTMQYIIEDYVKDRKSTRLNSSH